MKFPVMLLPLIVAMELPRMLTVAAAAESSVDRNPSSEKLAPQHRAKRGLECEVQYREYRSTHTLCLTDEADATEVPLTEDMKASILEMHNDYRRNVTPPAADMKKLVWDDRLARTALKWAMQCRSSDRDHDHIDDRGEPGWPGVKIGQSIGLAHISFSLMLAAFYRERERFHYTWGHSYMNGISRYFQMVSNITTRVGCAETSCPNSNFETHRVCNYAPAMDKIKLPYTSGAPCENCMDHCDNSGKLCDCGNKLCFNTGLMNVSICQCECQRQHLEDIFTGEKCKDVICTNKDHHPECRNGEWKKEKCGVSYPQRPRLCPHLCGLCDGGYPPPTHLCGLCDGRCPGKRCYDGARLDESRCKCTCDAGERCDEETGPVCPGTRCQGMTVLDHRTCSCVCAKGFSGDTCDKCPSKDKEPLCSKRPADECGTSKGCGHQLSPQV